MTIEEYSTRMGYLGFCSDEEYATADAIYLNAGNLDKDAFCADYKKHKGSVIIETLGDRVNSQSIWIRDQETKIQSTAHALLREADEIRQGGMEASRHSQSQQSSTTKTATDTRCAERERRTSSSFQPTGCSYLPPVTN